MLFLIFALPVQAQTIVDLDDAVFSWTWASNAVPADKFRIKCGLVTDKYTFIADVSGSNVRELDLRLVVTEPGTYFCRQYGIRKTVESTGSNEITFQAKRTVTIPNPATGLGAK